jgi:hypothetical protein
MKSTLVLLVLVALGFQLVGCRSLFSGPPLEVEILNLSSEPLEDAEAYFGEAVCGWGYVATRVSASHMSFSAPITDDAVLTWRSSRGVRREAVKVGSVLQRGVRGRLSFRVFDNRVEVRFFPKR